MSVLRSYQDTVIDKIAAAFRNGYRRPLVTMPTGSGKTARLSSSPR